MSHLPPQPWCEHCVRGRAPEADHKRVTLERADKELPVIAFDFAFLKTSQGSERTSVADAYATQLVAVDGDSGMIRVVPAPGKNVSDYLVTGLRKFVESTFHTKVRLRCDNEPAAVIFAERVKALLPGVVVLENTPRHDHAATLAERAIRSVEDQVRVLRLDIESRYGISLNANMSLLPWVARHAGWLLTRCKIKGNGCTPYQDAYGTKYSGEMLNIAETALFRFPYPDHRRISGKRTLHKRDVFETSLRDSDTRRSCDGEGGRLCCEQGADRENRFFFSTGRKCQAGTLLLLIFMLCGIRRLCLSKHCNMHDCRGMCGWIGSLSFVCGGFPLLSLQALSRGQVEL